MTSELIQGDCLEENKQIPDGSVDLILTDLPYGTMNGFNGIDWDYAIQPEDVFAIANRILRKNGKMVLFAQEPYTSDLIKKAISNVPFCYRMIWEKDNFGNALFCNKAPVGYFEDMLVFSKKDEFEGLHPLREYFKDVYIFIGLNKKQIIESVGQCADHCFRFNSSQYDLCTEKTYNKLIDIFNIDAMQGFKPYAELKAIDDEFKQKFASTFNLWEGGKYKSNILKYKKDYDGYHPTQKPVLLCEDLIKTFSNEGDTVADLTMGSGSTGVGCKNTNRHFIGIEQDDKYFKIAEERIKGR